MRLAVLYLLCPSSPINYCKRTKTPPRHSVTRRVALHFYSCFLEHDEDFFSFQNAELNKASALKTGNVFIDQIFIHNINKDYEAEDEAISYRV